MNPDTTDPLRSNVEYQLFTDASGNTYIIYTEEDGRKYTLDDQGNKTYLVGSVKEIKPNELVFMDPTGRRFIIDVDGSRRYLAIDRDSLQGSNFVDYLDPSGKKFRIFTDPTGNQYILFDDNTKHFITGLSDQIGNNFNIVRDVLNTEYVVYTIPNQDTYIVYTNQDGSRYFFNPDGSKVPLSNQESVASPNGQTTSQELGTFIFMDPSGNRFRIDENGNPSFLSLNSNSRSGDNPASYRDSSFNNYLIYTDENNDKYIRNADGTRNYITGYPTNPIDARTFVDEQQN